MTVEPNPHKALGVKRKYFPRPRGAAFSLTPFLRGHSSGGEGTASATRLAIGGGRNSGPRRPQTSRTQHSCGLWRPRSAEQAAVPGTAPRPVPIRVRSRLRGHSRSGGLISLGERPVRHGSRAGRVVRRSLLVRGGSPAGVGRTWDGASAPSPLSLRQPRADLVVSPDPPPGRGTVGAHRSPSGRRARPVSHQSGGLPGLRPRTYPGGLAIQ